MSAYREQKTRINDAECLMKALEKKGYKPIRHDVAVQLEGYHGDKRRQTAEIVIPRKQVGPASNDIGFKKQQDGTWVAIISDFDSQRHNAQWLKEVKALALEEKAKKVARKSGLQPHGQRTVLPNGKIRLQFVKA